MTVRYSLTLVWLVLLMGPVDAFQSVASPVKQRKGVALEKKLASVRKTVPKQAATANDILDNENNSSEPSSVASATFGVIKAMLGSGVLALPAGLAAMSNFPKSAIPASVLLVVLGLLSGYTFSWLGRLTHETQANSLGDLWKKVMGTNTSLAVSVANFLYCFGCCLTFSLVVGDTLSSLVASTGLSGWMASRHAAILAISTAALYPLCHLPSLAALAPVSIIGVFGTLISTLFLAWRCPTLNPGSPYAVGGDAGASLLTSLPAAMQPSFSSYNRMKSASSLILVSMGCVSLMAHFSAIEFYHSLHNKKATNDNTVRKFNIMTIAGYSTVALINIMTLAFGFLTFGGNSAGMILNNYSVHDMGASLSRFLVAVSVTGGFPFLFGPCRAAAMELWQSCFGGEEPSKRTTTNVLLFLITAIALAVKDAGFVVSFNGALMGSALIYVFPSLLFLKQAKQNKNTVMTKRMASERWLARFFVVFGVISAMVGGSVSVLNSYFPHLLMK